VTRREIIMTHLNNLFTFIMWGWLNHKVLFFLNHALKKHTYTVVLGLE